MALYIGGDFQVRDVAPNIVRWDGQEVAPVGSRIDRSACGGVYDLIDADIGYGRRLYAAGTLWSEDDYPVVLAEWDGSEWTGLGTDVLDGGCGEYLEIFDDGRGAGSAIYLSGNFFAQFEDEYARDIVRWGWPDLQLDVDPLIAGQKATLASTCARPNANVFFIGSVSGLGSVYIPPLNTTIDLKQPKLIATRRADSNGETSFTARVPNILAGRTVWLQAAQIERVSRVSEQVVQ